jgi:hypothetical protein
MPRYGRTFDSRFVCWQYFNGCLSHRRREKHAAQGGVKIGPWDPSTKIFETVSANDLIPMNEPTAEGREGFQVYAVKLMLPKDMAALDPATRRELMICDLFLTEKLTISEIVGVLDGEDQKSVILTLIKRRVLQDRRKQQRL